MWKVPPIQFIMNTAAVQLSEVEEMLKVADMGPDYEPTSLELNVKSQYMNLASTPVEKTDSSHQLHHLHAVAGPGGSVELVVSKTKNDAPNFAQHSAAWNGNSEDNLPLNTDDELTDEKSDNENADYTEMLYSVSEDTVTTRDSCKNTDRYKGRTSDVAESTLEIRSDIYGLDHGRLWQQVLQAKRKSVNRSYKLSDDLAAQFLAADSAKKDSTQDMVPKSKMKRRPKNERVSRNPADMLSCHYHNNVEE